MLFVCLDVNAFVFLYVISLRVTLKHGIAHWGTLLVCLLVCPYIVVFGQVKDFLLMYNISFINSEF